MGLGSLGQHELFGWNKVGRRSSIPGRLPIVPVLFRVQLDDHDTIKPVRNKNSCNIKRLGKPMDRMDIWSIYKGGIAFWFLLGSQL